MVLLHKDVNSTIPDFRVTELLPDHVHQVTVAAASGERVGPSIVLFIKTSPVASMHIMDKHITYAGYFVHRTYNVIQVYSHVCCRK